MSKVLRIALYSFICLLYSVLLLVGLLYFRFPEEKFKSHCIAYVEQIVPGMTCSISELSFALPLSVVFSDISFAEKGSSAKEQFHIEELRISPKISHLFEKYSIHAKVSKGNVKTVFSMDMASRKYAFDNIAITELQLAAVTGLETNLKRKVTGKLSVTGQFNGKFGEPLFKGSGQGDATLTEGSLQFLFPVLSMDVLGLQKLQLKLKLDTAVLAMEKGVFTGKELKGTFAGNLQFGSSFKTSRFSVKGELTPQPDLLKKSKQAQQMLRHLRQQKKGSNLPFRLDGMVITPALHLGS